MQIIDHAQQPSENWRPGVSTRMRISAQIGATQLTVFEQWIAPGLGAPEHQHRVEEIVSVINGEAEVSLAGQSAILTAGQSVLVPAGTRHGFRNCGRTLLHMQFTLAAPVFEATYGNGSEPTRRWFPKGDAGEREKEDA
jgi:quercetin dioxygenase-like cupin family protein